MEETTRDELIKTYGRIYTFTDLKNIFDSSFSRTSFIDAETAGQIPKAKKFKKGKVDWRAWLPSDLPLIGSKFGFLRDEAAKLSDATVTVYTPKGGVLKTTLSFTVARTAALHGIKTCIIGLDQQCDITSAIGHSNSLEEIEDLKEAIEILKKTKGLYNLFKNEVKINDIILPTDLPTLSYIPETHEIEDLLEELKDTFDRDSWLDDSVIVPLKEMGFQLIVIDCAPTSGRLIQNALVSTDLLLSPIQCKINQHRGFNRFIVHLNKVMSDLKIDSLHKIMVPTGLSKNKILSMQIFKDYQKSEPDCLPVAITENIAGEEAMAANLSIFEYAPTKDAATDMRQIMQTIFRKLVCISNEKQRNYNANIRLKRGLIAPHERTQQLSKIN